jgi:beta-N-acetylhexosaminidase
MKEINMIDINKLSLEEKVGQLFMIGLLREDVNENIESLLKNEKIGGVIIYKRNYNDYKDMVSFVNNIKEKNHINKIPLFISIDQEGGRVNRMPNGINVILNATAISKTESTSIARESGKITGHMLRKTGIFMNYAPVLDIKRFKDDHAIGNRCFGDNKEDVSKYGIAVMKELQKEKVIPVVKHFPGHGATNRDSHFSIPSIKMKLDYLEENDISVFENAIKNGADAIMVGHLIVKSLDRIHPASLSKKVISKYLIEKNNFQGLIITDDLKMKAIQIRYSMRRAALKAIEAGNDIIMMGLPYNKIKKVIKYIVKKVETGKISEERINHSVEKILRMKEKYEVTDDLIDGFDVDVVNEEIRRLNRKIEKEKWKKEVGL